MFEVNVNSVHTSYSALKTNIRLLKPFTILVFGINLLVGSLLLTIAPADFSREYHGIVVVWVLASCILYLLLRYFVGDRDWLSPDKLFLYGYLYFHYDYLLAFSFGFTSYRNEVFLFPAYSNITIIFLSLWLVSFLFGYIITTTRRNSYHNTVKEILPTSNMVVFLGKLLIPIGFLLMLTFIYDIGLSSLLSRSYGFNIFFSGDYNVTLFNGGRGIFSTGYLFLIISTFQNRTYHRKDLFIDLPFWTIVVVYIVGIFFLFSVRSWLLIDIGIPTLLLFHYTRKRLNIRVLLILGIIGLSGFAITEFARLTTNRTPIGFLKAVEGSLLNGNQSFVDLATIQWRTNRNANAIVALSDELNHHLFGESIIRGLVVGVPLLGKYFVDLFAEDPSRWLASYIAPWAIDRSEGIGFSLPGEGYLNFGWGSLVYGFLLGIFIGLISNRVFIADSLRFTNLLLYLPFIGSLLFSIRQTLGTVPRTMYFPIALIVIIIVIVKLLFPRK